MVDETMEPLVVGIGASAGGLDALLRLLSEMPERPGMCFVVVQHLDPTHDSALTEILARRTLLPVQQVEGRTPVRNDHVYVIPPGQYLAISRGVLELSEPAEERGSRSAVDFFFRSLAEDQAERAIGIVLSGTGTDGTAGLREIKHVGGLTVAQTPEEAGQSGMPDSAISSVQVDWVMPAGEMAARLVRYVRHCREHGLVAAQADGAEDSALEQVIELLRSQTQQDFRRYRRSTLRRRIRRRMGLHHLSDLSDYCHLLQDSTDEAQALRCDLLIGVTRFFRDGDAWTQLNEKALQPLLKDIPEDRPLRVWCAGCATGEEAYSLAIMLHEAENEAGQTRRIQLFATDVARDALNFAREGCYPSSIASDISPRRLRQFFTREGNRYRVSKRLRESVVFAEQNVLAHPPFSRLDLICCRNLLIYLQTDAQRRVMDVFQFALNEGGYLFLGSSESIGRSQDLFRSISRKWRIFQRTEVQKRLAHNADSSPSMLPQDDNSRPEPSHSGNVGIAGRVQRQLLRELEQGVVVINRDDRVQFLQGPVDLYLQMSVGELSAELPGLFQIAREGLRSRLRGLVREVRKSGEQQTMSGRVRRDGPYHQVWLRARPLAGGRLEEETVLITFEPVQTPEPENGQHRLEEAATTAGELSSDDQTLIRELEHELATTREQLNTTIQDLETANEELKASNEEAMSMNEELQSGNEELETSREELQSLNEELTTLNNQLELKIGELQQTNGDLDNLLNSSSIPTLFLDTTLHIRRFTPSVSELFHLISSDVGRQLRDITASFEDSELLTDAEAVLTDLLPRERQISTADDRYYVRRVLPYRTGDDRIQGVVLNFAEVTELHRVTEQVRRTAGQQKALAELGQQALTGESLQALFDAAIRMLRQTLDARFAKVLEYLPESRELLLRAGAGWKDGLVGAARVPAGTESQAGYTLHSLHPVVVDDLQEESRFTGPPLLLDHGVVSGVSCVIHGPQSPWGVLGVHTATPAEFSEDDVNFVVSVASILGQAIERKRQEHELATNVRMLSLSHDAIIVARRGGEIQFWNRGAERLYGFSSKEALGREPGQLLRTVYPVSRQDISGRLDTDGEWEGTLEQTTRFGTTVAVSGRMQIVETATSEPLILEVHRDISERLQTERRFRETQEQFRALVEATARIVWTTTATGEVVEDSPSWREFTGQTPEEWLGWGWLDAIHPDDRLQTARLWQDAVNEGGQLDHEYRLQHHSGEWRWTHVRGVPLFDEAGAIRGWVGMNSDITERKIIQEGLQDSERRLALALKAGGMAAWEWRNEQSIWTDELYDLLGLPRETAASPEVFFQSVHEEDLPALREAWRRATAGEETYNQQFRIVRPDGETRWILGLGEDERDEAGRVIRIYGLIRDITDEMLMTEAIETARQRAEQANMAKSEFLANMSHEIRTPMTAILGYSDLIAAREEEPQKQAWLVTIRRNAGYLLELINDILDLSRIEAGKLEAVYRPVVPGELLADVQSLMSVRAREKQLDLSVEFAGPIPSLIETDPTRLRQILINLVGNAIKFTEDGGVQILVRYLEPEPPENGDAESPGRLEFKVVDTGIGISEAHLQDLFQPFIQGDASTTRSAGGTGLGLTISQRLAAMLGGEIQASSRPDHGSTFSFSIPVENVQNIELTVPDLSQEIQQAETGPSDIPLTCHVLIVDDRRDVRYLAQHWLTDAGAQVTQAEDGQEAVDLIARLQSDGEVPFDLILLDMQMPRLDGYQTATRLRKMGIRQPIIALTADAMDTDERHCLQAGCDGYLRKPIAVDDLLKLVSQLTGGVSRDELERYRQDGPG